MHIKPLASDFRRYHVQACIQRVTGQDPRCYLGATGRVEIVREPKAQMPDVWFLPDQGGDAFRVPVDSIHFGAQDRENLPAFYRGHLNK